jgi:ribosomal protein S27E
MTAQLTQQPTAAECALATQIADRAIALARSYDLEQRWSRAGTVDDVLRAHAICPLDLVQFLGSSDKDFAHDVGGIRRHLNRIAGRFENGFEPLCAIQARPAAESDAIREQQIVAEHDLAESRALLEASPAPRGFFATVQSLRESSKCPDCGKTRFVFNAAARGFKPEKVTRRDALHVRRRPRPSPAVRRRIRRGGLTMPSQALMKRIARLANLSLRRPHARVRRSTA